MSFHMGIQYIHKSSQPATATVGAVEIVEVVVEVWSNLARYACGAHSVDWLTIFLAELRNQMLARTSYLPFVTLSLKMKLRLASISLIPTVAAFSASKQTFSRPASFITLSAEASSEPFFAS